MLHPFKNFPESEVTVAPSPATTGTTLSIPDSDSGKFPTPATDGDFPIIVFPATGQPTTANAEICTVTAKGALAGGNQELTITRAQQGTSARSIQVGDRVFLGLTKDFLDTLVEALQIEGDITNPIQGVKNENDMASNSAVHATTQAAVKSYVDNSTPPDATTTTKGVVELATDTEAKGGSDSAKSIVPSSLFSVLQEQSAVNLLKNGNFINNSTNGYGNTPDDWTSSSANPVQGGFPSFSKQDLIDILGVADGDIEGLWNLNEASGTATDLSSNGYDLTDTNTVTSSDDGLMERARSFDSANSEYLTASTPNANISTSQTWITFVNPSTVGTDERIMGFRNSGGGNLKVLRLSDVDGAFQLLMSGTGAGGDDRVTSPIIPKTGKWYMVVGRYDSAANELSIWVNGVKTTETTTSNPSSVTSNFSIGRVGDQDASYYDGLAQNAMILSTALSDDQVNRLWAYLSYKGQKIRRSTTDALLYQDLPQDLVERLRGKAITLTAEVYAESTNHRIYVDDGTVTANSPTSADTWETVSVTRTISSTATHIRIGFEADTTDGSMWVKEARLTQTLSSVPYTHSQNDWTRFPSLLRQNLPQMCCGYKYEENRWYGYDANWSGSGSMTISSIVGETAKFKFTGKTVTAALYLNATTGGSASNIISAELPAIADGGDYRGGGSSSDPGTTQAGVWFITGSARENVSFRKYDATNFGLGSSRQVGGTVIYEAT